MFAFTAFYATTVCLSVACSDPDAASAWDLIAEIGFEETEVNGAWAVKKIFPEALLARADGFEISGHYVPVDAQAYVTRFLIVPDPADCPYCGTSGYGPTLEVQMKRPMPDLEESAKVTLQGTLQFDENTETYRAVYLTDAVLLGVE